MVENSRNLHRILIHTLQANKDRVKEMNKLGHTKLQNLKLEGASLSCQQHLIQEEVNHAADCKVAEAAAEDLKIS
jgi:hypothetical protein